MDNHSIPLIGTGGNDQQLFISTISIRVKCPRNNRTIWHMQKLIIFIHCLSVVAEGIVLGRSALRHREASIKLLTTTVVCFRV